MKFQLMSRASVAALAGLAASGDDKDAGPAPAKPEDKAADPPAKPGEGEEQPAPPEAPEAEASQQVVAAADAQALIAEADGKGFARANARMTTVFASEEGKANPSLAAFMLANSTADATAIIGQLKAQGPAPAPSAEAAAPTIPNTGVDIGVDPQALADAKSKASEADAGWDAALNANAAARAPIVPRPVANADGTITVPAVTRTGN